MSEHPILFSTPMVRAILSGQKTVTRRPLATFQYPSLTDPESPSAGWFAVAQRHRRYGFGVSAASEQLCADALATAGVCPYGKPGDRLWVRETWLADAQLDSIAPRDMSQGEPIMYPADGSFRQTGCAMISQGRGRPSIHMPRWASRILLEITDIRVERLQDINEQQALAEGVMAAERDIDPDGNDLSAVELFGGLWVMLNGMESWNANPWVWVVEFRVLTTSTVEAKWPAH